jgi:hypothetical protein
MATTTPTTETANGYLLCDRHAKAWRDGGNTVAMHPCGQRESENYACADCADETDADEYVAGHDCEAS